MANGAYMRLTALPRNRTRTPASPHENGTHERLHRELKRETARPAAGSLRAQQRRFDAFDYSTLLGKIDERTARITRIRPGKQGVKDAAGLLLTINPPVHRTTSPRDLPALLASPGEGRTDGD